MVPGESDTAINLFGWEGAFAQTANDPDYEDEDAARLDIPIHAFDAIIADECHRGYTAKDTATWRAVLDHFDAIKFHRQRRPMQGQKGLYRRSRSLY